MKPVSENILFMPFDRGSLNEQLLLAQKIREDGELGVLFLLYRDKLSSSSVKAELEAMGLECIDIFGKVRKAAVASETSQDVFPRLKVLREFAALYLWARMVRREARKLLEEYNVAGLVMSADRHPGWETALVRAANQKNIPSVIIQYAVYASTGMVKYNYTRKNVDGHPYRASASIVNRLTALLIPKISRPYHGEKVLLWNYVNPLAYYFAGLMPKNPWVQGGGYAGSMFVEGEKVLRYNEIEGMDPGKMVITGKPSSDLLYGEFLSELEKKRDQSGCTRQSRILVAVPQTGEHNMLEWKQHLSETEFMFQCLARHPNVKIVLSLHPKSRVEDYNEFAAKYNAEFSMCSIYEEIPQCDVFVSAYTSTLTSALALRKQCVVISYVYVYGHKLFDSAENIYLAKTRADLPFMIGRAIDKARSGVRNQSAREIDCTWSIVDGQSTNRIVGRIYMEIERQQ